jgi:hypothetical protein
MQNRIHHLWIDALRKYKIWRNAGNPAMQIFEKLSARALEQFEVYDLFWLSAFSHRARSADDLKRVRWPNFLDSFSERFKVVPVC